MATDGIDQVDEGIADVAVVRSHRAQRPRICIASLGRMSSAAASSPQRQTIIQRVASPTRFVIIDTAAPPARTRPARRRTR
jgi:hypothetical protein